ncbi:uncharacterized protein I303_100010 [Kwoniella dejecticola CBS 10117]|uniref:Transcription factor domain-containing protein n=1 Tax=Kwoniella dejecticola CBS 10117 TaxID=1296121 RepID=A0A1A6ADT0_9TREE|nr:uncharacterized protein I303_00010 [Kwoniella dejecticola CBS 10117]OBR88199.1 hypothetical protein I303_00010 [Kwoniella dejecticola CBS 10117]
MSTGKTSTEDGRVTDGDIRNDSRSLSPMNLIWTRPHSISPSAAPNPLSQQFQPPSHIASSSRRPALDQLQQSFPTSRSDQITLPTHISSPSAIGGDLQHPLLWLAECARQGWDSQTVSAPLGFPPSRSVLPSDDLRLLNQWGNKELFKALHDQQTFFQHGLYGTKRDVSEGLDPVQKGLIVEEEVLELFDGYFRYCHLQMPILDTSLHTPSYVRSRSAYLFTVILMVGAIALATLPSSLAEYCQIAIKLHTHAEKLQSVLCATAAKSTEIVQAEMLFIEWGLRKNRLVDDQRWARMGWASRLTSSIGLQHAGSRSADEMDRDLLLRNDFRLRVSLILFESRWEAIADRKAVSPDISELSVVEVDRLKRCGPFDFEAILAADYELHLFEVDSKERLSRLSPHSTIGFEAEKSWISTFLTAWEDRWLSPHSDSLKRWHYRYISLRSRLVGLLRISRAQSSSDKWTSETRQELLRLSIQMLEGALCHERALHMIGRTSALVFASTIILQLTEPDASSRDLILRVALRLAGDPNQNLMTYEKHNGFQLINMLCLSSIARGTVPQISDPDEILDLARNSFDSSLAAANPASTEGPPSTTQPSLENAATEPATFAWADFEQVFGTAGIDFPYFPTSASLQSNSGVMAVGALNADAIFASDGSASPGQSFGNCNAETDTAMRGYLEYISSAMGD